MENKSKILIVEDNPANMELFVDILESSGYICVQTEKGEEALEIAKKEKPDLVLLDIQLSGIDGMAVERNLRSCEDTKRIKVVALTAHAMKGDEQMFLEKGFDGYIPKPIRVNEFVESVKGYLSIKR